MTAQTARQLRTSAIADRGTVALICGPQHVDRERMAMELAADVGSDLWLIDVSRVVSRYIGETEKNLRRLFDEAERRESILFFDEADALFGRRAAVGRTGGDRRRAVDRAFALMRRPGLYLLGAERVDGLDPVAAGRIRHIVIAGPPEGRTDAVDSGRER